MSALAITQDRLGFLWVGTEDGLNRYDGFGFRVFRHQVGDPGASQLGGAIEALHADRAGHLWIGMRTGGFSRFDPSTERFTHYLQGSEHAELSRYEISCLHEDRAGHLWVGARGGGLIRLDPSSGEILNYRHRPGDPGSLAHDVVEALAEAAGRLWIGTYGGGLQELDPATGRLTRHQPPSGGADRLASLRTRALAVGVEPSGPEVLWVGTDGAGLFRFELPSRRFVQVSTGNDPRDAAIWALAFDRSGTLWIGTQRGGLIGLDPETEVLSNYRHSRDDSGSLSSNDVRSIFEDRAGNLWVGTWTQGLNRFHPDDEPFLHYEHDPKDPRSLSEGIVMALHEDRSGALWVGTTGGLNHLPAGSRGFRRQLPGEVVLALHEDRAENFWVGVPGVLHRLGEDRRDVVASHIFDPEAAGSQAGNASMALVEDRLGHLWIGTYRGVHRFEPSTRAFHHFRHEGDDPTSLSHDQVTSLLVDRSGLLWAGTFGGLNQLDPSTGTFRHFLSEPDIPNLIMHLFEDRSGILWIGTFGGGLLRFEAAAERLVVYTEADGMPNNVVYSILEDALGRLWLSTNRGLARFDPDEERFTVYDPADGLLDYEFNLGAGFRGAGGWMYFGNLRGVEVFRPERFRDNLQPPPMVITSFKLFQEEADLGRAAPYLEKIELSHHENFFSFEFAALNFRRPDKNRYRYFLEGVDQSWVDSGARPFASYTDVSPGEYVFRLRASNNDGVWNEDGIEVGVTVHPPLWATWWAYAFYALSVITALGGFLRWNRRKVAHEQAVVRRLREIDRLKDDFLANISHELRTPLHGMTGLAESLIDGAHGKLPSSARRDLGMIVSSGRRLTGLVNDILDFSKLRHRSLELRRRPVDLRALVDVVLALVRPLVADKGLELKSSVPTDLPPVDADEDRLQQILLNLVGNAVKFTEEGRVEVTARVEDQHLLIQISDTGPGVPEAAKERIFEAFGQVDATATRDHAGTGLGLAVSRRLAELHGGELWLESSSDQGSTFCLSFPLATPEAAGTIDAIAMPLTLGAEPEESSTPISELSITKPPEASNKVRLLVVDDEPVNRQVLVNLLELEDYVVDTAASGATALQMLEKRDYALVLLDVMMPKMSGYEICAKIRERYSLHQQPVIFLTARSRVDDLVAAFAAGGNDYLTKPVSKNELLTRVRSHLDQRRLHFHLEALIDERTEELRERERLIADLERLVKEIEYINYVVSHDLRNPLVTIKNFVGLAKKSAATGDSERLREGLSHIDSAAEQMHWLLDELIRFSRVDQDMQSHADVALDELTKVVQDRLQAPLDQYRFEVRVANDLPRVKGDPALLIVLLQSLFENAVKFIGDQPAPRIEIGWRRREGELVLFVRDNGMGIAAPYQEKVFGLFNRLSPEIPGTGVGLAMARRIVESHGGKIWVESAGPGQGSTFFWTLSFSDSTPTIVRPAEG